MEGSERSESTTEPDEGLLIWRRIQLSKAKLKGVTEMCALLSGFCMIATVELTIAKGTSEILLVSFTVTTALLVSTTMLAIMIATCILPHIDAVAKLESLSIAKKSPHDDVSFYIDLAWFLANTVSIFLFIVDVILLCWIKFPTTPAISITVIMIPVLILLCIFSIIFYRQTVHHQIYMADKKLDELRALSVKLRINTVDDDDEDDDNSSDQQQQQKHNTSRDDGINNMLNPTNIYNHNSNSSSRSGSRNALNIVGFVGLPTPSTSSYSSVRRNDYSLHSMP